MIVIVIGLIRDRKLVKACYISVCFFCMASFFDKIRLELAAEQEEEWHLVQR